MSITDLVEERVLLKRGMSSGVSEYKVLEIAPSGNWVKLMNMNGQKFWVPVTDLGSVEVLKPIAPGRPDKDVERE